MASRWLRELIALRERWRLEGPTSRLLTHFFLVNSCGEELNESLERVGVGIRELSAGRDGASSEVQYGSPTGVDAMHSDVGVFLVPGIVAGWFSDGFGRGGGVEDVVHNLEGDPEAVADFANKGFGAGGRGAEQKAHLESRGDEVRGLMLVDGGKVSGGDRARFAKGIEDLATDEVAAVCGG